VIIAVGGPNANTVTKDILAGTQIDLTETPVVVKVIDNNKIVVAGYTADDTIQAGKKFLAELVRRK
jgi:hypothetical protein